MQYRVGLHANIKVPWFQSALYHLFLLLIMELIESMLRPNQLSALILLASALILHKNSILLGFLDLNHARVLLIFIGMRE